MYTLEFTTSERYAQIFCKLETSYLLYTDVNIGKFYANIYNTTAGRRACMCRIKCVHAYCPIGNTATVAIRSG